MDLLIELLTELDDFLGPTYVRSYNGWLKSHVCHTEYVTCMSHANQKSCVHHMLIANILHLRVNCDQDLVMEYGYLHLHSNIHVHIPSLANLLTFIINTH